MTRIEMHVEAIIYELKVPESKKAEYRLEFIDHINSLKEEYLEMGHSEEASIELAIKDFGNRDIISTELNDNPDATKSKINIKPLLQAVAVFSIIVTIGFLYWVNSYSSTPESAIAKHIKSKSITSSILRIKVKETGNVDNNYGKQFVVTGVTGEYKDIIFFYLKEGEKGWKVVAAGTGP
jgi:hypothetical protein